MMTENEIAARMFPSMPRTAPAEIVPERTPDDIIADRLYRKPVEQNGLYPTMTAQQNPQPAPAPKQTEDKVVVTDPQADQLFGDDVWAGDLPSDEGYYPSMSSLFDAEMAEASSQGDMDLLDDLDDAREGLNQMFGEFTVGAAEAREICSLIATHTTRRLRSHTAESLHQAKLNGMNELKQHYGSRYDDALKAARRVSDEIAKVIPYYTKTVNDSGLGNDPRYIRKLVSAAHRKGWI